MAFNLAEAAGLGKLVPNLDTHKVVMLPVAQLDENDGNFFRVEDVQDLKDSMEIKGILQPLLVVPSGDRYRIIAGHRRRKAAYELHMEGKKRFAEVPCIVLPKMSEAMEQVTLIQTNTTARELSYPEKMESAKRLKTMLVQLKEEGVKIPGKLRDIVAEQLEISRSELARMQVIDKGLIDGWRELLDSRKINAYCAYELARIPVSDQEALLQKLRSGEFDYMNQILVENYMVRKECSDWLVSDCPLCRDGYYNSERRRKGLPVPCPGDAYRAILKHKKKGHPELCPGCCYKCPAAATCGDCCGEVRCQRNNDEYSALRAAELEQQKQAFRNSCLSSTPSRLSSLFEEEFYDVEEIKAVFGDAYCEITGKSIVPNYPEFSRMASAETSSDLPLFMVSTAAFCSALDVEPNELLGFEGKAHSAESTAGRSGWRRYPDEQPSDGARVTVRRKTMGSVFVGEYRYRDGKWFNPDLDDFEMNITNVTHWILAPDE